MQNLRHCLVTGGAGFIGSHLVEHLLAEGHRVTVVDNLCTGRIGNLRGLGSEPRLSFHRLDVTRPEEIQPLFRGVDWVFHLAARAEIVPSIQDPKAYVHANVEGTFSALECARTAGVERFIYAASSSCYGIPDLFPTPETAPIRPMYPYALTKHLGEQAVLHWAKVYSLPALSLRLFNVYGPRSRTTGAYGAVFGVFLAQRLAGQPYTVVGDGTQTRDFTFVTDVARAFAAAARSSLSGEVFNVGLGKTASVNRLVEILGGPSVHIPKRPGEPDCTFADISKIRSALSWEPQVDFEKGVQVMLEHIDDWREAPVWDPQSIDTATRDWFRYLSPGTVPVS